MNQSFGAGFVDGFANSGCAVCYTDTQRIGRTSRSFTQYLRAIKHNGPRARPAAVHANNQLPERRTPAGQNVDGLDHSRHLVIRCPERAPEISILGIRETIMETKRSYSCD